MDLRSGTPPVTRSVADGDDLDRVAEVAARLEAELAKVIVGQQRVVREILMAFLAGGHCLLRFVPGLAKTLLIDRPLFVLATQNPIEQEGTYPLPDSCDGRRRRNSGCCARGRS